jgi:hypothetical protein
MEKGSKGAGPCGGDSFKGAGKSLAAPAFGGMSFGGGKGAPQSPGWGQPQASKGWGPGGSKPSFQAPAQYAPPQFSFKGAPGKGYQPPAIYQPYQPPVQARPQSWEPIGKGHPQVSYVSPGKGAPIKGYDAAPGKGPAAGKSFDRDDAKIFVGGLPKTTTDETVGAYFGQFGAVIKVEMKMDPATQQSRGFCFVTFEEAEAARSALAHYDAHEIDGKWIEVKSAMVDGKPAPGQKGGKGDTGAGTEPLKIFVGGIPKDVDEERLGAHFTAFGEVTEVLLKRDEQGLSKGFGFVSFADEASVAAVINNHQNNSIDGKWIDVKVASVKGETKGKGKVDPGCFGAPCKGGYASAYAPKGFMKGPPAAQPYMPY